MIFIYLFIHQFLLTCFDLKFAGIQKHSFKNHFEYETKIILIEKFFSCNPKVIFRAECFGFTKMRNTKIYSKLITSWDRICTPPKKGNIILVFDSKFLMECFCMKANPKSKSMLAEINIFLRFIFFTIYFVWFISFPHTQTYIYIYICVCVCVCVCAHVCERDMICTKFWSRHDFQTIQWI